MALEERLELDISEALRGIDTIEDALTAAAQSFRVGLAEALDILGSVQVGEVDASAVTTGITEAVEAADLEPEITADASGVTDAIDDAVGAADTEADITADASPVTDAIDSAVGAADTEVGVEADASGVTDSIDAAIAEANATVSVDATTDGITEAIEQAVAGADAVVEVEADTSAAEAALDDLGSSATGAATGLSDVSGATDALGGLSAASTGSVLGLERGLDRLGSGGALAAGAITAVALSAGELFQAALDADTADRRFAQSLGDIADRVAGIRIDGFADDLEDLSEKTGASDENLKLAAARIADLGNSAGASQDEIAGAAENILLLATRASVLNPALGEAGEVADTLTNALARGGRALAPYGINLSSAAIQARAVADANGDATAATDRFALSAAGAALVTEQLGSRLKTDIVEGAKSTEIQLRSLREQFGNALETFGRPLLEPVLQAAQEGQPILLDLAETFGQLASTALPTLIDLLRVAAPIISSVADVVGILLTALQPVLAVVDAIPEPVLRAITTFLVLQRGIGSLLGVVGLLAPALAASLGPLGLIAAAVGAAVIVFQSFGSGQEKTRKQVNDLTRAFADQAQSIQGDIQSVVASATATEEVTEALRQSGVSVQEFARLSAQGADGLNEFLSSLERTGQVSPEVADALRDTGGDVSQIAEVLGEAAAAGEGLTEANAKLIASFAGISQQSQEAAQAQITNLVNTEAVTEAQVAQFEAFSQTEDGIVNYVQVLTRLEQSNADITPGINAIVEGMEAETQAAKDAEDALNGLLDAQIGFLDSAIAAENANREFGESLADVTNKADLLANAIRENGRTSDEAKEAQEEYNEAVRESRDAALQAAEAELRRADDLAAASGKALTAAERQDIFTGSLQRAASQAKGDSKTAIEGLIGLYGSIPDTKETKLLVDTKQATAAVKELAKLISQDLNRVLNFGTGSSAPRLPGAAVGGSFLGPGQIVVGEQGREVVTIGPATAINVATNRQSEQILSGGNLGPELTSAIRSLIAQPRFSVEMPILALPGADPYPVAMETSRQLDSLAVRLSAQGST